MAFRPRSDGTHLHAAAATPAENSDERAVIKPDEAGPVAPPGPESPGLVDRAVPVPLLDRFALLGSEAIVLF